MSTMKRLLFSTQQIQVENQNLMIQHMQWEDVQDFIAVLNAEKKYNSETVGMGFM